MKNYLLTIIQKLLSVEGNNKIKIIIIFSVIFCLPVFISLVGNSFYHFISMVCLQSISIIPLIVLTFFLKKSSPVTYVISIIITTLLLGFFFFATYYNGVDAQGIGFLFILSIILGLVFTTIVAVISLIEYYLRS